VISNPVGEPIQDGGELNGGEAGDGESIIASRYTQVPLDAAEEVFHAMALPVVPSVELMQ